MDNVYFESIIKFYFRNQKNQEIYSTFTTQFDYRLFPASIIKYILKSKITLE